MGSKASEDILKELGSEPGHYNFEEGVRKTNEMRIKKANHRNDVEIKKRRKVLRGQKKKKDDKTKENEGPTYEAGGF